MYQIVGKPKEIRYSNRDSSQTIVTITNTSGLDGDGKKHLYLILCVKTKYKKDDRLKNCKI